MAAINARKRKLADGPRAWAAVPAFASRLSAIAAICSSQRGLELFSGSYRASALAGGNL